MTGLPEYVDATFADNGAQKIQDKLDAGAREIVLRGIFNFGLTEPGDPPPHRKTVEIRRGVTIRAAGRGMALILGGGASLPTHGFERPGMPDNEHIHSGPFRVRNRPDEGGDDKPVVIEDLWFAGWKGEAIFADAFQGLEVTNCTFTHPVGGRIGDATATFTHAVLAAGPRCTGNFVAQGNVCDLRAHPQIDVPTDFMEPLSSLASAPANDEQFIACFGTWCSDIRITDNQVWSSDAGVEALFNNLDNGNRPSSIEINYNEITLDQSFHGEPWPGSVGILCTRNNGAIAEIVGNVIKSTGNSGIAFFLSGEHSEARPLTVHDNESHQVPNGGPHFAAMILGSNAVLPQLVPVFPGAYAGEHLGPLNGARISNNVLAGEAMFGFLTFDAAELGYQPPDAALPLNSHDNGVFENSVTGLIGKQLHLSPGTHDNYVKGCFSSVENMGANVVDNVCPWP